MTRYLEDKKASAAVLCICFIAYTIIAFARNAYTAAVPGIIAEGIFTKVDVGTINSSFFLTYGAVQIFGSFLTDKIAPFKIILLGLLGTVVANIAMAVSPTYTVIFIARAASGVAQFGTWPALLKIVAEYVNKDYRRSAMYIMPLGMQAGYILSYLVAAVVLTYGKWKDLFTISYILLAVVSVIFVIVFSYAKKIEVKAPAVERKPDSADTHKEKGSGIGLLISSGALILIIPIFAKSLIESSVTSWFPTMIMESYSASAGVSSALTVIVTCAGFLAVFCVAFFYPRIFKTHTVAVGVFFAMIIPMAAILMFIGKIPLAVAMLAIVIIAVLKSAIHQFFTVEIPAVYTMYNKAGTVAGIINAVACLASVVSGVLYGYLAENFDWNITALSWGALALFGVAFSFIQTPMWKRFLKKTHKY